MQFRHYIPEPVVAYIKLIQIRRRYPKCNIWSHLIGPHVHLGLECTIARDVELARNVSIGNYSYVNAGTVIASGKIGHFCSIGYFCQIGMPEHPLDFVSTSPRIYGHKNILGLKPFWNDYPSPPIIESDIWIGSQAIILQHVHIGVGAVIAGGAVVTKDVEPYTIVAGVPAKIIRKRFDDSTVMQLLESEWWNWSIQEILAHKELFRLQKAVPQHFRRDDQL